MKLNKIKKLVILSALTASVALTGCSSLIQQGLEVADRQNQPNTESTNSKDNFDSTSTNNDTKLNFAEIEELAATCVYGVDWYTSDDMFAAGTSFIMDSDNHGKVIVSAFHYLWPEDASSFSGKDLASYITGGNIYNACTYDETGASLKNCVIIEDADISPNTSKDVSAFTIQNGEDLNTLPLSTHEAKKGDTVYLLANLWDTDDIHENCVYEGTVISDADGIFSYRLDSKYGTAGASGAPIVNEYGEVVAIHMGSNGSIRIANSVTSFASLVENGTVSDIVYEDVAYDYADRTYEGEEIPAYTLELKETMETMFFDLQINSVSLADTLQGIVAPDGYQYMVVNISMEAHDSTPVYMYYHDFALMLTDQYIEPLEVGYTENQLPDEYTITNTVTTGDLVFAVPLEVDTVLFDFVDYYFYDNSDEIHYDACYDIVVPVEDWSR